MCPAEIRNLFQRIVLYLQFLVLSYIRSLRKNYFFYLCMSGLAPRWGSVESCDSNAPSGTRDIGSLEVWQPGSYRGQGGDDASSTRWTKRYLLIRRM